MAGAVRLQTIALQVPSRRCAPCLLHSSRFTGFSLKSRKDAVRLMAASSAADSSVETAILHSKVSKSAGKKALISLSDKREIDTLAKGLRDLGFTLVSTGGTAKALESSGFEVTRVEQLTEFPEMLDGRVKTLHPAVHGGILARRDLNSHLEALSTHGIGTIDVVVVNLYPFYDTVTAPGGASFDKGVENIDIGGPAMIRAAAKNHKDVLVVVDPADYPVLLEALQGKTENEEMLRRKFAQKAFQHVASYDSAISEWLWKQISSDYQFPQEFTIPLSLSSSLRYGENPHQKAAVYLDKSICEVNAGGIATAKQHHGKEMSYNNYLDVDAAWNCVCEFREKTCVVVKHTNPCGVASRKDILEAYRLAVEADSVSAFGGIVAFNVPIDDALAREIREFIPERYKANNTKMFYEIIIAPGYTEKGLQVLKGKAKNLRILEANPTDTNGRRSVRQISGGWLAQDVDSITPDDINFRAVTNRAPTESEMEYAKFAWLCVKHVKSNAIVVAKDNAMLGMGSGQPNRVKSLEIAIEKAGDDVKGAALASDAFFPFAWGDAVEEACKAGVSLIVQPGGSIRDQDAIDCCNKYGVAMLFTDIRHFRH